MGEVGVETFAKLVQELLVQYLSTKYGDVAISGRASVAGCVLQIVGM